LPSARARHAGHVAGFIKVFPDVKGSDLETGAGVGVFMGYGLASFDQPSLRNFSIVVVVMPDAFTEQAVQKRAAFLEPSELRVFFCYFQVLNSECLF
jgi:hypothetical protein